ncbi:MAG: hypothetical protein QM765_22505 [Myxococcales bacterium]
MQANRPGSAPKPSPSPSGYQMRVGSVIACSQPLANSPSQSAQAVGSSHCALQRGEASLSFWVQAAVPLGTAPEQASKQAVQCCCG